MKEKKDYEQAYETLRTCILAQFYRGAPQKQIKATTALKRLQCVVNFLRDSSSKAAKKAAEKAA